MNNKSTKNYKNYEKYARGSGELGKQSGNKVLGSILKLTSQRSIQKLVENLNAHVTLKKSPDIFKILKNLNLPMLQLPGFFLIKYDLHIFELHVNIK